MSQTGILAELTSGAADIEKLTGNSGGAVGPDAAFNVNLIGSGSVTVTGNPGTNTLTISVSGSGASWNVILAASATMSSNNGYLTNNAGVVTLTLPATSSVGDYIAIIGMGNGGWSIAQGVGQQVRVGANISTAGVGGSVSSFEAHDSIELICSVANTTWVTLGAPQSAGLTIV
jgi:hypothetical protein